MTSDFRYGLLGAMARWLPKARGTGLAMAVCSPGHLGDILHAVPMLRALRAGRPDAKIIWLVGPWSEALARRYAACVDEIRLFGPNLPQFTRGKRDWRQSLWRQWRMALELRTENMDVFIGPMDAVGRFLANAIAPRLWVGIVDLLPPRVLKEIETVVQPYEKDRFEADALCGLLAPLGIVASAQRLEYAVAPEEQIAADVFLKAEGVDMARPLVLIAPGSGWSGKNWFPERFGDVAKWLAKEKNAQVGWVGGSGEDSLVPAVRASDFIWTGKTPRPLLAAVMERANALICNDGGLLHLAAAVGQPTVSVWGPTRPGKWGPKEPLHRQIRKVERCDGCIYWDYRETCRHDHACMRAVAVEDVLAGLEGLIDSRPRTVPAHSATD